MSILLGALQNDLFFQDNSAGRIRAVLPMVGVRFFRPLSSFWLVKLVYPSLFALFPSLTSPFSFPFCLCLMGDISSEGGDTERQKWGAGKLLSRSIKTDV